MLKQTITHMGFALCIALIAALLPAAAAALPVAGAQQAGQADWVTRTETVSRGGEEPQQETPPIETKLYPLQHLGIDSAYTLAESACLESNDPRVRCNVEVLREEGTLVVIAIEAVHARVAALLAEVDRPPHTQTFHIIVLAATDSASTPSDLPPGAQRAMEDIKAFLPYEGFRVLDTGWLKTAREGQTTLTGPTGFEVGLEFRGSPSSGEPLLVQTFQMTVMEPAVILPEGVQGETRGARRRLVLETSFSMDIGETVVVGTSKLNGNNEPTALVILLTALAEEENR